MVWIVQVLVTGDGFDGGIKTRGMSVRAQNSPIFKAVEKFYPQFPAKTTLAAFSMFFQTGSLGDCSLSSRFPV